MLPVCIAGLFLIFQAGSLSADEVKRDIFDLGYDLGRPCSQGLEMNQPLSVSGQVMSMIRRCLNDAIRIANDLGFPPASIERLLRDAPNLTRAQYLDQSPGGPPGRSRLVMDEYQSRCRDTFEEAAVLIFTQGVWMGGAECTAVFGDGFSQRERPGTYALIGRNVSWMRGNDGNIGLAPAAIDRLADDMNRGMSFGEIEGQLERIRSSWRQELLNQSSFYQVVALSDSNWESEVLGSSLPVIVIFGTSFNVPSIRQVKIFEGLVKRYKGKVKFASAYGKECPQIFRQQNITAFPIIRLYRAGQSVAERQGLQNEEAITSLIESNLSSGDSSSGSGLLGIEMGQPTW